MLSLTLENLSGNTICRLSRSGYHGEVLVVKDINHEVKVVIH
jgi:hypothetical protein